jgi:hypothetical protein
MLHLVNHGRSGMIRNSNQKIRKTLEDLHILMNQG